MRIIKYIRHILYPIAILIIVFLTGFAAIHYQVVLERLMKLVVGGTITSSFIITYATLIGMGIGALIAVLGKTKLSFHTLLYASGAYTLMSAVFTLPLLQHIASLLLEHAFPTSLSQILLYISSICILLPASILSGATIPRIIQYSTKNSSLSAGALYGIYTLGSGIGIYTIIRVFLPLFTFHTNFFIIAGIYFFTALMLYVLERTTYTTHQRLTKHVYHTINKKHAIILFISSATTIVLEISIFRSLSVRWGSDSAYAFPFALITYLIAYAIGSIFLASFYKRIATSIGLLPLLLLLPLGFIVTLFIPKTIPDQGLISLFFLGGFQHTALVACLSGAIFPLILYISRPTDIEYDSGVFSFISSIGTFVGGLLLIGVGFPYLGTQTSVTLACIAYVCTVYVILANGRTRIFYGIISGAILLLFIYIPSNIWATWIQNTTGQHVQSVEGSGGIALINWADEHHTSGSIVINGTPASYIPHLPSHATLAVLASGAPNRSQILLLGLGGGGLTRDALAMTNVKSIDVVEWSREVISLLKKPDANKLLGHALDDDRVILIPTDARTYTTTALAQHKKYSLIVDNLTVVGWSGSTSIRSIEYFQSMMPLLTEDGVYIVYIHHNFDMHYQAAVSGLARTCPYIASFDQTYIICANHEPDWDIEHMDNTLNTFSKIPALQHALKPQPLWIYQKYRTIDPTTYAHIEPIHDTLPYFEYEPFAIQKKY